MALTHIIHKEHPLGQILVQEHVLHPEVQWEEETNFILGWKLAHISSSKGRHTLGTQGAGTGLLPVGIGKVHPTYPATLRTQAGPKPYFYFHYCLFFLSAWDGLDEGLCRGLSWIYPKHISSLSGYLRHVLEVILLWQ